ncbi:DUF6382 domain-containing protein [Eubacterium oxidoreducens]|uniref:FHA domain-containing protein n=1 Tax=Eubacterium oxidoreducens TaxID=1732 RepID=A0A1G6A014_EUBOX|nr:DUF6382 domain-containing protein [Eubacterium oxidoreducens]SDB01745.1 FHA domain-containing protein [Eubacterium oxidoreducens]
MEIRYQRDLNKSYMVIQRDGIDWEEFELRMMQQNRIPGLLEVFQMVQDQKLSFLYDISGMQSLDVYLNRNEVSRQLLEKLIFSLKQMCYRLEDYLLNEDDLVLSEETVFIKGEELRFVYLPGSEQGAGLGLMHLMEFILGKIDHSDRNCVELAYRLYQKTTEENFSFVSFLEEFKQDTSCDSIQKRTIKTQPEDGIFPIDEKSEAKESKIKPQSERRKFSISKGISKWLLKDQKNKPEDIFSEEDSTQIEYAYVAEQGIPFGTKESSHPTIYINTQQKEIGQFQYQGYGDEKNFFAKKEKNYIGKQEDADIILQSESVSRLHALITRENSSFYLEDLNSTNGTYVNEKEVQYKEKVMLRRGDEIRFGDAKYAFY